MARSTQKQYKFTKELKEEIKRYLKLCPWLDEKEFKDIIAGDQYGEDDLDIYDLELSETVRELAEDKCLIRANANENCCGVAEVQFASLNQLVRSRPKMNVKDQLRILVTGMYCGAHITQAYSKLQKGGWKGLESRLTKIVEPTYLGVNPNTGMHIYEWRIAQTDFAE